MLWKPVFRSFYTFTTQNLLSWFPGEGEAKECERKPPSPVPGPLPLPAFSLGRKIKGICWLLWLPLIGISGFRAVYSASSKAGEDIYSCLWQILTFFQAFREKSQRHFMKTAGAFDFFRQLTWILSKNVKGTLRISEMPLTIKILHVKPPSNRHRHFRRTRDAFDFCRERQEKSSAGARRRRRFWTKGHRPRLHEPPTKPQRRSHR